MLYPAVNDLANKVGNRYSLVIVTAKRARQIVEELEATGDISDDKEEETEGGEADFGKDDDQPINREVDPFVAIAAKQEAEEGDGSLEIHAVESRQIVREGDEHREAREAKPGKKEEEGDDKAAGALIHADNDDVDDE